MLVFFLGRAAVFTVRAIVCSVGFLHDEDDGFMCDGSLYMYEQNKILI